MFTVTSDYGLISGSWNWLEVTMFSWIPNIQRSRFSVGSEYPFFKVLFQEEFNHVAQLLPTLFSFGNVAILRDWVKVVAK
jgi:hypothetical protein